MEKCTETDVELGAIAAMLAWILQGLCARGDQPVLAYFVGMAAEVAVEAGGSPARSADLGPQQ